MFPRTRRQAGPAADIKPPARRDAESAFGTGSRMVVGTALAVALLAVCGGWAAMAHLDGAVIANGVVKVDRNLKAIQHRDGGMIKIIAIREGDAVRKGQVLIALDDFQTRAELSIVRTQVAELSARRARLLAERDSLNDLRFPEHLASLEGSVAAIINGETRLFHGNRTHRESQTEQLEFQVTQLGEELRGLEAQLKGKVDELTLIEAEYAKLKPLFSKGLIESTRIYSTERELARMVGERGGIEAAMARAKARTSEIRLQIIAIEQNARTEAQRELSDVDVKFSRTPASAVSPSRTAWRAPRFAPPSTAR